MLCRVSVFKLCDFAIRNKKAQTSDLLSLNQKKGNKTRKTKKKKVIHQLVNCQRRNEEEVRVRGGKERFMRLVAKKEQPTAILQFRQWKSVEWDCRVLHHAKSMPAISKALFPNKHEQPLGQWKITALCCKLPQEHTVLGLWSQHTGK